MFLTPGQRKVKSRIRLLLDQLAARKIILVTGASGSGKSYLAQFLSEGWEGNYFNLGEGKTLNRLFRGRTRPSWRHVREFVEHETRTDETQLLILDTVEIPLKLTASSVLFGSVYHPPKPILVFMQPKCHAAITQIPDRRHLQLECSDKDCEALAEHLGRPYRGENSLHSVVAGGKAVGQGGAQ